LTPEKKTEGVKSLRAIEQKGDKGWSETTFLTAEKQTDCRGADPVGLTQKNGGAPAWVTSAKKKR